MTTIAQPDETLTAEDARFDEVVERWLRERLVIQPEWATYLGIHEHDHRLSLGGRDGIDEEVAFTKSAMAAMDTFRPDTLSPNRALDRDLVLHEARLRLFDLVERQSWAGRSDGAEAIGGALFPLFTRDFAPLTDRLESIAARLEAAPRYLEETRDRVDRPVQLWTEIDIQSGEMLPSFLETIQGAAADPSVPAEVRERLAQAIAGTVAALDVHQAWLRDDVLPRSNAAWETGPEQFEELVRLRELEASGDEIQAVGEEMLAEGHAQRNAVCAEIDPARTPAEVADLVKNDYPPTFEEALEEYRRSMDRARAFVAEHDLATLPPNDTLVVIETPSYIRHLVPFAAYFEPARFDPIPQGTYIVTPPETPDMMREHNYASISNTSVHEAYPGHHQQLSAAITNPSLVRLFSTSPEFAEGWAFYTERMMKEAGFDNTPTHRYVQLTDAIWRATRIVLDVRLHRGEIGFDAAVDRLIKETGFEHPAALAEVKRYTSTPTYQLSYLYGRHMIEALRRDIEQREGDAFSLKRFHDTLLYGGTMPVSYARRLFDH
ncbi:MAG TPA: DUF885 domain-containing protein [Candidatus Limnocylindria bacterium]